VLLCCCAAAMSMCFTLSHSPDLVLVCAESAEKKTVTVEAVAKATVQALQRSVPPAVPGITVRRSPSHPLPLHLHLSHFLVVWLRLRLRLVLEWRSDRRRGHCALERSQRLEPWPSPVGSHLLLRPCSAAVGAGHVAGYDSHTLPSTLPSLLCSCLEIVFSRFFSAGKAANVAAAQQQLQIRAKANSAAALGQYKGEAASAQSQKSLYVENYRY
jgi:hypothetical protein